ncbi:MAG: peptide deformylase [Steroidobacteraceae bacterium]
MPILELPDQRLRQQAAAVDRFDAELQQQISDLFDTLYAHTAIGLAATQVDLHRRIIVMDVSADRKQPQVFVNPRSLRQDTRAMVEESCLSVPGISASVPRCVRMRVAWQDPAGRGQEQTLDGLAAVCLQHEMDHLEGRLFTDRLSFLQRLRWRKRLRGA